ncbi:U3 small nucleolar RNA-associated protein 25 homolog [Lutzomyia longipalpis]|uniref:U3 small nucleolar RNA-associated protein 25 homolog n=1 Tax=Lutzomyia longipalpis TaxID=7200 RepID=UPI0024846493|nr:U3 small nucleolar RNA-associated protein 25 homolog [Lutzomyia longipalpis]
MVKHKNSRQKGKGNGYRKKNYKHSRKNSFKGKPKKVDGEDYKFVRKMKTIQRNTENEEIQRKRLQIEARSLKRKEKFTLGYQEEEEESGNEEENDYYDKVLSMLNVSSKVSKAIETSSEEDDSNDENETQSDNLDNDDEAIDEDTTDADEEIPPKRNKLTDNSEEFESEADDEEGNLSDADKVDSESEEKTESPDDPYLTHLDYDLSPELYNNVAKECEYEEICEHKIISWTVLGRLLVNIPRSDKSQNSEPATKKKFLLLEDEEKFATEGKFPEKVSLRDANLNDLYLKSRLQKHAVMLNRKILGDKLETDLALTNLQAELFSIINNYQDLYMPQRTFENSEEIRFTYCLHAMNHVLKSYTKVTQHNAKMSKGSESSSKAKKNQEIFRDQGLVRPKILIILPFKSAAYHVINMLIELLVPELAGKVINHKRYVEEFTGGELEFPQKNPKPEDYEKIFSGNSDDNFRIGISVTKKCLKLYSEFYSADFIVASPLGLRMIIGAAGDEKRDYDFLASIEMLIIDQMDVILSQNWLHLLHIFDHLHLNLQTRKNTDFARVRSWCVNGWSRFYRQTLLFSNHDLPEFVSLLSRQCRNYRGSVRVANPITVGSVQNVSVQIHQVFHRIEVKSLETANDTRFEYFVRTILPRFKAPFMAHCLIFVPNYFDFVRIRNYFKKESISFVQVCEYTEDAKMARARDMFYHSGAHFMLYTERAHFYRRTRIKGIRHIVMYQPPSWPHFYPELLNLMQTSYQNPRDGLEAHTSITVLYTKYDALQTAAILGTEQTAGMLRSSKLTHTVVKEK